MARAVLFPDDIVELHRNSFPQSAGTESCPLTHPYLYPVAGKCDASSRDLALSRRWQHADLRVALRHMRIKQPLEGDEAERGMPSAVCGGDYAPAEFAYCALRRPDAGEFGNCGHAD